MRQPLLFTTTILLFLVSSTLSFSAPPGPLTLKKNQALPITIRPGGSAATSIQPAGQSTFPTVLSVNPAALNQGQVGTLMLSGRHLHHNMRLKLGTGITTGEATVINEAQSIATVPVNVAADATPGSRVVQVQYKDRLQSSPARISVIATNPSPLVRSITPNALSQGKSYTLTLTGSNLEGVTAVNFGSDITAAKPVAKPKKLTLNLTVAATAKPGPRQVALIDAQGSHPASVAITVTAAQTISIASPGLPISLNKNDKPLRISPKPSASLIAVQTIIPNQWAQGKSYPISVFGSRFKDGIEADFGDGIEIQDLKVASATKLTMTVKISGSAPMGLRPLNLRDNSSKRWSPFAAKAWVVARKDWSISKPIPKLVSPDLNVTLKGRIKLLGPEDYLKSNEMIPEILNEQTLFSWREENPGLAEWYEFRLVSEDGYVIDKKRINPAKIEVFGNEINHLPTSLRMDTAYLLDLLTKDWKTHENVINHGLSNIFVWWEVAGYKTFVTTKMVAVPGSSSSGPAKTKKIVESKDVEVEISDRWSLLTPHKPSGLACSGGDTSVSAITIANIDKGNRAANYPQDQWELSGKINIRTVPYAIHPGALVHGPGDIAPYLPNVFVDWGDGSGATPLEIDLSQPSGLELLPLGRTYHHRYQQSGNYTVRIFVLPEGDIQQGPPDALASVYDEVYGNTQASAGAVVPAASNYNPYFRVLKGIQKTSGPDFQFSGPSSQQFQFDENSLYAMAGRAHMIYCETKKIAVREDLVAQGPLHLEAIAITGYNGSGSAGAAQLPPRKNDTILLPPNNTSGTIPLPSGNSSATGGGSGLKPALSLSKSGSSSRGIMQTAPKSAINIKVDAEVSACDILQGNAGLTYYGEGRAKITWNLYKGNTRMVVGSSEEALASPLRTEGGMVLNETTQDTPTPESYATAPLTSPVVEMNEEMINKIYSLVAEAEVLPQTSQLSQGSLLQLLETTPVSSFSSGGSGFAHNIFSWLVPEAHAAPTGAGANPHINSFQQSGVKLSVLAPSKEGISGRPVMASLNLFARAKKYPGLERKKEKPYYVKSERFDYRVKASDPEQPCKFVFPTSTGDNFEIRNLDVQKLGGKFRGNGVLDLHLYTGQGGTAARYILPITIGNWSVAGDGLTVTAGSINHSLDYSINEAGMRIELQKLAARAGQTPMNLTLGAKPADTDLHLSGSTQPPEWTATAPLSEDGDWYFQENSTMEVEIGNSGFSIKPKEIVLDLSATDGMTVNPQGAGKDWAGLHFGADALLIPNLFEFQVPEANKGQISNWGVEGTKLVGKAEITTPFSTQYKEGTISFDSISVDTGKSSLALYRDMDVDVPWLDTHLKGDAQLIHGAPGQEAYFDFTQVTQNEIVKEYRGITMTVRNLLFGNFQPTGWGAWSESTTFRFEAEKVVFAENVVVPGIIYSMDGRPFLENGNNIDIPLGGKSTLGATPIDLVSVRIDLHSGGPGVFSFDFATTFSISEVLSSVDVPVRYAITRDGNKYTADGPRVNPFDLEVAFPAGQPRVDAKIHIEYTGDGLSSNTAAAESPKTSWPFGVTEAHAASGAKDSFAGSLDMAMFDGPPIAAEFRLGYLDGHDYWLMRATLDLGPSGIPFVPPYLKLYKIRGGLGHNFPLDAFQSAYPITVVEPVTDDSFLFMAGMQVGTTDGFVLTMDGDLTIKPGDGARMDFRAWLLSAQHTGNGNFQGYLQYAANGFDGALTGHLDLLSNTVYFDIPENACTMHFGGNEPWHIYAGQEAGPKIRMHMLITDVDGYMMLDEEALRFGGGVYYYLGADIGHISGEIQTGLTLTPQPHISGYGQGGVRAEVCYKKCIGAGISVRVDVSALPVSASARGCVTIPIPCWNPEICRTFSL
jgi:Quinohemoprotein amine dehydrogenase, alpha subunit domain III